MQSAESRVGWKTLAAKINAANGFGDEPATAETTGSTAEAVPASAPSGTPQSSSQADAAKAGWKAVADLQNAATAERDGRTVVRV